MSQCQSSAMRTRTRRRSRPFTSSGASSSRGASTPIWTRRTRSAPRSMPRPPESLCCSLHVHTHTYIHTYMHTHMGDKTRNSFVGAQPRGATLHRPSEQSRSHTAKEGRDGTHHEARRYSQRILSVFYFFSKSFLNTIQTYRQFLDQNL